MVHDGNLPLGIKLTLLGNNVHISHRNAKLSISGGHSNSLRKGIDKVLHELYLLFKIPVLLIFELK